MRTLLPTAAPRRLAVLGLLLALFSFGGSLPAVASHLLGGEVRYRSLGLTGTTPGRPFRYEVSVSVFINCSATSQVPLGRAGLGLRVYDAFDNTQIFDVNNPGGVIFPGTNPGPGGNDPDFFVEGGLFPFSRNSITDIAPPTPPGCSISTGCVRLITYVDSIDLPGSGDGYYFVYSDRTRNQSATNLLNGDQQDQVLYTFVPDPLQVNRSPIFTDTAVALLCAGDTATLINNASDPDGDRLSYEFYAPFRSGGNPNNPNDPGNVGTVLTLPLPGVVYAAGFSSTAPFGPGSYAFINGTSGLTRYVVPNAGDYVVGVRVNEFRRINGRDQLVSSVVREIQLAVRNCPNLPPPSLQFSTGASTSITIEEGAIGSFVATASVAQGNTLRLTATSPLLDGPGGANATFNGNVGTAANTPVTINGTTSLTGTFQFTAACGSAGVYNVNIAARDLQGCPVKTTSVPYLITVTAPARPSAISGDSTVCPNTTVAYTAVGAPATTTGYQWTVTGGTIQGSATGATVNVLWTTVGTGTLQVTATSARGCPSPVRRISVQVFSGVTATLSGLPTAFCLNPTGPGTTLTGAPAGGTFSITGPGGTTNLVGNVFTPRVAGTFQVTYSFNDPTTGCAATSVPLTVVVNPLPVVTLAPALPATICSNSAPVQLTGTVNGAAATTGFTIDGVAATVFNPAALTPGAHVVALVGAGVGNCTATATRTVTVNAAPVVALTGLQASYCKNDPAVPLTATANGVALTAANVTFNIDGTIVTQLNPATLTVGFHRVRVLGTGPNGCQNVDSARFEIKALPELVVLFRPVRLCEYDAPFILAGTVDGVAGGTFTIDGNTATVFDPGVLSVGLHSLVFSGTGANACQDTVQYSIRIYPALTLTLTSPTTSVCLNAAPVTFSFNSTESGRGFYVVLGTSVSGTFPNANTFSFTLDPRALGVGTFQVTYGMPIGNVSGCGNTDTLTFTVRPLPAVAITGLQTAYCRDAAPVTLAGTVNGVAGGTFTIDGTPATTLNPATLTPGPHRVILTGTGANGCATSDTTIVQINALPTVAFTGLNPAYCAGSPAVTLAATVNAGTTNGPVTFTVNGNPATSFNPSTLTPGTYTVVATGTLTATGCQNTVTQTVTINALPTVAITNLSPAYCVSATAVSLTSTLTGGTGTVSYTVNGAPATTFNPATLGPGTYTVVATGTVTATTCQGTATQTVTVNALPTVAFTGLNPAYCQGAAAVTLASSIAPAGTVTYTVNGTAATTFDPSTLAPGTYTVVATGTATATSCVGTATQTVTINARPTVAITGLNPAYCASAAPVTLAGTVTGGAGTTTFTVNGTAATTFDPSTLTPGTYTVVATGTVTATGCQNTVTQTVTINALPTVAITGLNPTYCQGDAPVTLGGTVNGAAGTTTFTVNGTAATTFDPSTLVPGTYTVVLTGTDGVTCQNTATQTVTINARPTGLTPSGPPSVCPGLTGVPYSLPAPTPGFTYQWTVTGGTVASGQGTDNITVDWGPANAGASVSVVTVDVATTCRSLPIALPVTVNQILQTQTPTGTAAFCVNGGAQTFAIPLPTPGSVYDWVLTPATAGTVTAGQGTASITVTFTQPGTVSLVVTETSATPLANCRGVSAPLILTVQAAPDPTLVLQSSAPAVCATGAPVTFTLPGGAASTYQFTVDGAVQPGAIGGTFSFPATTPGTYTVGAQETNAAGCVGPVITTTLTVNPVPTALAITGPAAICPQGLTNQTYSVTGLPGSTFQWTLTGGTITSGQGTSTITVDFDGTTAPTLTVTETSAAGCAGPAAPIALALDAAAPSLTLASVDEAQPANQIDLTLTGLNAQAGQQLVIQRRVSGSGAYQQVGTVAAPATTFTDNSADPNAAAYDYRVDLTNACGTVLQSAEQTTVRVTATATETSGDVTLTWNEYRGQAVTSYEVLRKNGAGGYDVVGTVAAGTLTYSAIGVGRDAFNQTFRVRAVLAANAGVSFSNEATVTFENKLNSYNVITPNGDNLNDRFVVENAALYPNNELTVFNRWGREVYRKTNYDNSWDGGDLPAGTYYYLFTANNQTIKSWVEIVK